MKNRVTKIDMSGADMSGTPSWGFVGFRNTSLEVVWPTAGNITQIPREAFKNCGFQTLSIPGYITKIVSNAIVESSNDEYLKSVIFEEYDSDGDGVSDVNMDIEFQAFQLVYGLSDVFIETEGDISAANNAFPHHQTYGHGNVNLVLATLHFPEGKAEDYVNMDHELDEATANDNGLFQAWLVEHYSQAGQKQNGWFEFVSNGVSNGEPWPATFLRTYSHPTLDQVVPHGVKAYVVSDITTSGEKVTLKLTRINVIPAGTGVILFGGANGKTSDGEPTLNMMAVNYTGDVYDRESTIKNYLTATCSSNPDYSTPVAPYGVDHLSGKVYRDFVFGKFSNTDPGKKYYKKYGNYGTGTGREKGDWYGFFRVKAGSISDINPGKAYLHLSTTEYPLANGGEIIMDVTAQRDGSLGQSEFYRTEYHDANLQYWSENELKAQHLWYLNETTKIEWKNYWGVRDLDSEFTMAKFMGEIEDEDWMNFLSTSGLSNVEVKENKGGDIYNLQGMKVAQPTKGIYIQNGKKYIVK